MDVNTHEIECERIIIVVVVCILLEWPNYILERKFEFYGSVNIGKRTKLQCAFANNIDI